jgi:hypothetical protein
MNKQKKYKIDTAKYKEILAIGNIYEPPPLTVDELAKGNKLEKVQFIFPRHEGGYHYVITINAEYGYGTNKSKLQKYRKLEAQVRKYVMGAPLSYIERVPGITIAIHGTPTDNVALIE